MWTNLLSHGIRNRTRSLFSTQNLNYIHSSTSTPLSSISQTTLVTHTHSLLPMSPPAGSIVFNTVGRVQYGFDVFSVDLHHPLNDHRLTDGISINFNAQFLGDDQNSVVFVSERTGSPRFYLARPGNKPQALPFVTNSLYHDRPNIQNGKLYFASTHEQPESLFKSWSAVYSTAVEGGETVKRLTPPGEVDYSPAVSLTGKFIAVASFRSRPWRTIEFRELQTEIVVFPESNPENRVVVSERGGWPTWSRDSTVFFHRIAEDGWWSIFRVELPESELSESYELNSPVRVTPPGLHCFTPVAFHDGQRIAVATRRKENNYRHIEIYDLESQTFQPITESINPSFHHYNPFVSPNSRYLGYHRFRGESTQGESTYPHLDPVQSPVRDIQLLRLNGSFPSFSPNGDFIAFNHDFDANGGVKIIRSNGSKRWTLLKGRTCFYNAWSPTEENVIYTSIGPIFESASKAVQIARIEFDPVHLTDDREDITPSNIKILTRDDTGNNAFPSCSPDGKSIVFRSGRSGHKNLYIVDAVNGEFNGGIRRLTEGEWIDTMPCWSPKGDLIAFSSNRHNPKNAEVFGIYVVKPDGSGLRRIEVARGVEAERERLNHVCFSGDGEWLLFTANIGGVTAEPVSWPNQFQPYGDLYVMRLDGRVLTRLTCNAYENGTPTWHHRELAVVGNDVDGDGGDRDKLNGAFQEPLWLTCDI